MSNALTRSRRLGNTAAILLTIAVIWIAFDLVVRDPKAKQEFRTQINADEDGNLINGTPADYNKIMYEVSETRDDFYEIQAARAEIATQLSKVDSNFYLQEVYIIALQSLRESYEGNNAELIELYQESSPYMIFNDSTLKFTYEP